MNIRPDLPVTVPTVAYYICVFINEPLSFSKVS